MPNLKKFSPWSFPQKKRPNHYPKLFHYKLRVVIWNILIFEETTKVKNFLRLSYLERQKNSGDLDFTVLC